jgi:hypothetical protein
LLRLFLDRQRTNQSGNLFGRLPFGELPKTFLAGPDTRVDDLQEQLTGSRIEDEDGSVWVSKLGKKYLGEPEDVLIGLVVRLPSKVL